MEQKLSRVLKLELTIREVEKLHTYGIISCSMSVSTGLFSSNRCLKRRSCRCASLKSGEVQALGLNIAIACPRDRMALCRLFSNSLADMGVGLRSEICILLLTP